MSKELNGEKPNMETQATQTAPESVKPPVPDDRRAATYLFAKLDQPAEFNNRETVAAWTIKLRECMGEGEFDLQGMKDFIDWVLDINARSAEYMRVAKNPAATLQKNMPTLLKFYKAYLAGQAARANLKKNQLKAVDGKPKYRQESGKNTILTGDI